jgi:hypothetical protein
MNRIELIIVNSSHGSKGKSFSLESGFANPTINPCRMIYP